MAIDAGLAACSGEEIVVLGASAVGPRVTVAGASTRSPGAPVELLTTDGWLLGRTTVGDHGTFSLRVRVPQASPRVVGVQARLADGEQSPVARLQRENVLERVERRGNTVTVYGTLARRARGVRARIDIVVPGPDPCGPGLALRARAATHDPRTGRYRATARLDAAATKHNVTEPIPVIRARVTVSGPGLPRWVTTSQPILAVPSDIGSRPG